MYCGVADYVIWVQDNVNTSTACDRCLNWYAFAYKRSTKTERVVCKFCVLNNYNFLFDMLCISFRKQTVSVVLLYRNYK